MNDWQMPEALWLYPEQGVIATPTFWRLFGEHHNVLRHWRLSFKVWWRP